MSPAWQLLKLAVNQKGGKKQDYSTFEPSDPEGAGLTTLQLGGLKSLAEQVPQMRTSEALLL